MGTLIEETTMECFYCGKPASGVCTRCHKAYCRKHGDGARFCYRCRIDHDTLWPSIGIGLIAMVVVGVPLYVVFYYMGYPLEFLCTPPISIALSIAIAVRWRNIKRKQLVAKWESEHAIER